MKITQRGSEGSVSQTGMKITQCGSVAFGDHVTSRGKKSMQRIGVATKRNIHGHAYRDILVDNHKVESRVGDAITCGIHGQLHGGVGSVILGVIGGSDFETRRNSENAAAKAGSSRAPVDNSGATASSQLRCVKNGEKKVDARHRDCLGQAGKIVMISLVC